MTQQHKNCDISPSHVDLRDTFAAAALAGYLANENRDDPMTIECAAADAYRYADAMLREREKSRAGQNGDSAANCPERDRVTEPLPKEKRADVSDRSYEKSDEKRVLSDMKSEPLAWAVIFGREHEIVYEVTTRREVANEYLQDVIAGRVVPLYRRPTLTENEIDALYWAMAQAEKLRDSGKKYATLRSLLSRLS